MHVVLQATVTTFRASFLFFAWGDLAGELTLYWNWVCAVVWCGGGGVGGDAMYGGGDAMHGGGGGDAVTCGDAMCGGGKRWG